MGIFPVWGFQMLIAIAVSFIFRLNKMLVIIAANVSIPPMIPIVIYLSHLCGALWMGDRGQRISFDQELTLDSVMNNLVQYILGAVTLAVVAGALGGAITYVVLKTFRKTSSGR
ncbi:MAG: DUF2062 domain-containing protein [Chryseolinea sp.]